MSKAIKLSLQNKMKILVQGLLPLGYSRMVMNIQEYVKIFAISFKVGYNIGHKFQNFPIKSL